MITVLLFASLREKLDCDAVHLDAGKAPETVAQLLGRLLADKGPEWQEVLAQDQVMVAVNQEVADVHAPVADGDEVAFFPPVTGG